MRRSLPKRFFGSDASQTLLTRVTVIEVFDKPTAIARKLSRGEAFQLIIAEVVLRL